MSNLRVDELESLTTGRTVLVDNIDTDMRKELANPDKGAAMVARGVVAVESIADLLALPEGQRKEGLRYLVSSYHGGLSSEVPFVGQRGGGVFRWVPSRVGENDGGVVLDGWVREIEGAVTPQMFGARGDGLSDDREPIQNMLDYVHGIGGGSIHFPPCPVHYSIRSTHPDYPEHGLILRKVAEYSSDYKIYGNSNNSRIVLDTDVSITSLMYWPDEIYHSSFRDLWFDANRKAEYTLKADESYHPYLQIEQCDFRNATEVCVSISTFLATLTRITTMRGRIGFRIVGQDGGPITSITMNSCYALLPSEVGYSFGFATYCVLNACAVDGVASGVRTQLAYRFSSAYGVSMVSCGCERVERLLKVESYRGFTLSSPYMLNAGGAVDPVDYLVEFVRGMNATVSGIQIGSTAPGGYNYKLASTTSAHGYENITVLDGSVSRSQMFSKLTHGYNRPIKLLRGDSTQKHVTVTVANTDELKAIMSYTLQYFQIDHDYIIQLADGVYDLAGFYGTPSNLGGSGRLTLRGNADNREAVTLITAGPTFRFESVTCGLVLKDITISGSVQVGQTKRVSFLRCPRVLLSNVAIQRGGVNVGWAVYAEGSNITLADGTVSNGHFLETAYSKVAGSTYYMEATTPPSSGHWPSGFRITNPTPAAGGYAGFVCTASGAPGTWKGYGAIEA